jgi:KUP system potassium uptake protein
MSTIPVTPAGSEFEDVAPHPPGRWLALAALGVVFGDIGTSPIYAFRECAAHGGGVLPPADVLGVLSLMTWTLLLVVTGKYAWLILRSDNDGEGGTLALMALARRSIKPKTPLARILLLLGILGASLFFADGIITPAISVLSSTEGLRVAAPSIAHYSVPLTVVILLVLFAMQRAGTGRVGVLFGPFVLLWFVTLALLGIGPILKNPGVLAALNPLEAVGYFVRHGAGGITMIGFVFLVATGAEALYADLGHFGRGPIRKAWLWVALPGLMINYFGQGALVLADPSASVDPFFRLAPASLVLPLVILCTLATIIASQAVISGTFSLARQAMMLGLIPRMEVRHTSGAHEGQIYVPLLNGLLLVGTLLVVLGFGSSTRLAAAYGLAVALTMFITVLLLGVHLRRGRQWNLGHVLLIILPLIAVDGVLVAANSSKITSGGWLPLTVAGGGCFLMIVWRRGQELLQDHTEDVGFSELDFLRSLKTEKLVRVPGAAVVVTRLEEGVPRMLLHLMRATKTLHETVVILTLDVVNRARVPSDQRLDVVDFGDGIYRLRARFGFMERPDVPGLIALASSRKLLPKLRDFSYFLGRIALTLRAKPRLRWFPRSLFTFLFRNARPATLHLGIPPSRSVEVGVPVEI